MSVPQMNYSVPPPRMDVPPPSVVAAIPPPSVPASIPPQITPTAMPLPSGLGAMPPLSMSAAMPCTRVSASAVSAAMPSSQIYNIPPYYNLPSTNQTAPYVPMSTLPPLNMPPPAISYPLNFRSLPPPPPSTYSLPSDASNYSSLNYSGTHIAEDTFTIPPPKFKSLIRDDRGYFYDNTPSRFTHFQDRERHHDLHSLGQYNQSYSSSSSPVQKRHRSPLNSRHKSHSHCDKTYSCRSPSHNSCRSPARRERSPARKERIPARRERSPACRERSPARKERTPSRRVRSPSRKERSPYHREKNLSRRERSPSRRDWSPSHRERSSSHRERSLSRRYHRSPSQMSLKDIDRYYDKRDYRRYESERRHSSPRHRGDQNYRHSNKSHDYYDDRRSHSSPNRSGQHSNRDRSREKSHHSLSGPSKPMTDREKILEEYRKNYCKTSDDLIENMQKWSKEHNSEDEEASKMWYRSSPAELYYAPVENGTGFQQTSKLEQICDTFFEKLILRGRQARPEVDELPPLNTPKGKMCKHHSDDKSSSSSSESEDDCLDDEGLQGFTDTIMFELQRKQSHPRRLHPEMWFNNTGEMNGGLLCRCSARARRQGMRHGVYVGEGSFPKCIPNQNNIDKLYHYRITVSPPTNFLIKSPTIIAHDEHEFLFSGFSMFSHYKLGKLPTCKVIRFNIEYTILYVEEPAPLNFTIKELDLFEEFLFYELLELVDLDLGKATETSCSQFHFMPRFVRYLPESGCEVLSMCEVLKYLIQESGLLIPPENLETVHAMDHYTWQKFVDRIKGMIVTYPGKKPCSVRVDQLDRSPPTGDTKDMELNKYFPEIVHFGIRPPQLSYAGNPEYQKAWRYYVKYRHLIANMAKPSLHERQKLAAKEATLQEMRTQSKMKRDVTVAISSEGFHTTGLMCDIVQHAMLIPVLVKHLRFHKSLDCLEKKMDYVFKQRALLQTALTHPSYRENFGTNPDHARNSLTNCGIRQPEYGDRRIHYTRKKGIVTLINIMSRFGKHSETESEIKHNERLEFLGDAVVEFLSSIHLFRMFPGLAEGGLATYRASIVQNQHLAHLAKNIGLEQFMLYAHGSDLCRDVVMRHAMANCFEALMGALFLDAGLEVADRVFALALWHNEPEMLETWMRERPHPLQEQEPLGDRQYIADIEFLQKLTKFEDSIGLQFKHIRLLARAFTDRSVGFTHLTLGSNQRLEFLGDTVVQLVVSDRLYRHFPDHHEGHLSLLRSSLVNNRTQAMICDDLNMVEYATYNNPKAKPTTKKHKADLLEAFLGALYIDKNLEYCQAFCNACLFPRLQEFIMNQDWNDPKSKLQQCCLTLRSMEGGEPDIPVYKVIQCLGPTNTRVYTVGVYFRGKRLAAARGHSIQEAEMNAAEEALSCANELFPQLDHQKRVIAKSMPKKKGKKRSGDSPTQERTIALKQKRIEDKVPKAYKLEQEMQAESSDESIINPQSDEETARSPRRKSEDSGLDSDEGTVSDDKYNNVQVSSLLSDMHRLRDEMILKNEYEKLKEKCRRLEADE